MLLRFGRKNIVADARNRGEASLRSLDDASQKSLLGTMPAGRSNKTSPEGPICGRLDQFGYENWQGDDRRRSVDRKPETSGSDSLMDILEPSEGYRFDVDAITRPLHPRGCAPDVNRIAFDNFQQSGDRRGLTVKTGAKAVARSLEASIAPASEIQ